MSEESKEELKKEEKENKAKDIEEKKDESVEAKVVENAEKDDINNDNDNSKEIEELNDRYKRLYAEFENYKKRTMKERESLRNMLVSDIMTNILPIIDNLEKAISAGSKDTAFEDGIKLVLKQLKDVLSYNGVKEIETVGKPFDPELHEAVSHVTDEKLGQNIIKEEFRKGYIIGNKVIRHSMVIVAN